MFRSKVKSVPARQLPNGTYIIEAGTAEYAAALDAYFWAKFRGFKVTWDGVRGKPKLYRDPLTPR